MDERDISDLERRADLEDRRAVNTLPVDVGPIGRVHIRHLNFVIAKFDKAMGARDAGIREDDVRRCRASDFQTDPADDVALLQLLADAQLKAVNLFGLETAGSRVKLGPLAFFLILRLRQSLRRPGIGTAIEPLVNDAVASAVEATTL